MTVSTPLRAIWGEVMAKFIATRWDGSKRAYATQAEAVRAAGIGGTVTAARPSKSSGAKQAARETRAWARSGVIEGSAEHHRRLAAYNSRANNYASALLDAKHARADAGTFLHEDRPAARQLVAEHGLIAFAKARHAAALSQAAANRPRLPNPAMTAYEFESINQSLAETNKMLAEFKRKYAQRPVHLRTDEDRKLIADYTKHAKKLQKWLETGREPTRNPSSGAKQRARGTRKVYHGVMTGGYGDGSAHARYLDLAAQARIEAKSGRENRHLIKKVHAGDLKNAGMSRPRLPNPGKIPGTFKALPDGRKVHFEPDGDVSIGGYKIGQIHKISGGYSAEYQWNDYMSGAKRTKGETFNKLPAAQQWLMAAKINDGRLSNPSSGAKQRARGTRDEDPIRAGKGAVHARALTIAKAYRDHPNSADKKYHHREWLKFAGDNRPRLPNPGTPSTAYALGKSAAGLGVHNAQDDQNLQYLMHPSYVPGVGINKDAMALNKKIIEAWMAGNRGGPLVNPAPRSAIVWTFERLQPGFPEQFVARKAGEIVGYVSKRGNGDMAVYRGKPGQAKFVNYASSGKWGKEILEEALSPTRNPSSGARQRARGTRKIAAPAAYKSRGFGDNRPVSLSKQEHQRQYVALLEDQAPYFRASAKKYAAGSPERKNALLGHKYTLEGAKKHRAAAPSVRNPSRKPILAKHKPLKGK